MYSEVGTVSRDTINRLQNIAQLTKWKTVCDKEKHFFTSYVDLNIEEISERWPNRHSTFFLRIKPGGKVHKHIDSDHTWQTFHIPIETNEDCVNYMEDEPFQLRVGKVYLVDRSIEHHSVNNGDTDRVHLLVEAYGR